MGDWVRIKNLIYVRKGMSKFKEPMQVIALRRNAVQISDGTWWSLGRVALTPKKIEEERGDVGKSKSPTPTTSRRIPRNRCKLKKEDDCILS